MQRTERRGRKRTGTTEWHEDHWDIRPTLADGSRGNRLCQPKGMSEAKAREKAAALTERAQREGRVREQAPPNVLPAVAPGESVSEWCHAWCEDRERRGLSSVDDDRGRLRKWILPRLSPPLGQRSMRTITSADLVLLVEDLDERVRADELSWKTAKNTWGIVTKMFKDAVKSKTQALRVRNDNPALHVTGPDEGVKKSKAYVYPAEFLALVTCPRVPIRWRRLFAWAIYSYERAGELEAQGVEDIDLDHRVNHVHRAVDRSDGGEKETKTNMPRRFPIEENALPLAKRLIEDARAAGRMRLVDMPPLCDLSGRLRQYLAWAGVTRAELFADDATRKQITFHDLRATGITWMAIRGDEPQRIMHRAGHENMSTTMGYVREAEALEYLRTDVFPPLPEELFLPDILPEGPATWATLRNDYYFKRPQRDSNPRNSLERAGSWAGLDDGDPRSGRRTLVADGARCKHRRSSGRRLLRAAPPGECERLLGIRAGRLLTGAAWSGTGGCRRIGVPLGASSTGNGLGRGARGHGFDGVALELGAPASHLGEHQPAEGAGGGAVLGDGSAQAEDDLRGVARVAVEPGELEVRAAVVAVAVTTAIEANAIE